MGGILIPELSLRNEGIRKDGENEYWDALKDEIHRERLLVEHLLRADRLVVAQENLNFRPMQIDEEIQGIGLGLFIVRMIQIKSQQGNSNQFYVWLPF